MNINQTLKQKLIFGIERFGKENGIKKDELINAYKSITNDIEINGNDELIETLFTDKEILPQIYFKVSKTKKGEYFARLCISITNRTEQDIDVLVSEYEA